MGNTGHGDKRLSVGSPATFLLGAGSFMKPLKKTLTYFVIASLAVLCALSYHLFVFPNDFAPAGLSGICTMIQYLTGISVGYLSLLINIPLAIWVYFSVSRPLALRSSVFIVTFSVGLLVLERIDLSAFAYATENGTSAILGPLVGGIIYGTCYSMLVRVSSNSGGMDFIAAVIHKHKPETNLFYLIFAMNVCVAVVSYFVYGYKIAPVILGILSRYPTSTVTDKLTKRGRSAIRFEIITDCPDAISDAIIHTLHHSATLLPAKGMYRGKETSVLICVVNKSQIAALSAIIRETPNTFAVMSQVGAVMGNFRHLDKQGHEPVDLLDSGDSDQLLS